MNESTQDAAGLRAKLAVGRTSGLWVGATDPRVVHAVAAAGFDWACIDEQHGGAATGRDNVDLFAAVHAAGLPALARVAWNRPEFIGRALDSGADGIIVPMVETVEQAEDAVAATRFAPRGRRSFGPIRSPHTVTRVDVARADREVACLVMIETEAGLAAVEQIAAVDGLTGIFVGPLDLSLALGLETMAMLEDRAPDAPLRRITDACTAHGLVAGAYAGAVERATALRDAGFDMLATVDDLAMISEGALAAGKAARAY